jgi:hypothetical protein
MASIKNESAAHIAARRLDNGLHAELFSEFFVTTRAT